MVFLYFIIICFYFGTIIGLIIKIYIIFLILSFLYNRKKIFNAKLECLIILVALIVGFVAINLDPETSRKCAYKDLSLCYTNTMILQYYTIIPLFVISTINLLLVYAKAKSTGELYLKNSTPKKL